MNENNSPEEPKRIIEALLFTSPEPLQLKDFKEILDLHGNRIKSIIQDLNDHYERQNRAFEIREIADGYQLLTRAEFEDVLRDFYGSDERPTLSQAALETLSIVAYEQPITRAEVESIRGVQSGQLLRSLLDQGFLKIKGRKETAGRPILYGTTKDFLKGFGLSSLDDLPEPDELIEEEN